MKSKDKKWNFTNHLMSVIWVEWLNSSDHCNASLFCKCGRMEGSTESSCKHRLVYIRLQNEIRVAILELEESPSSLLSLRHTNMKIQESRTLMKKSSADVMNHSNCLQTIYKVGINYSSRKSMAASEECGLGEGLWRPSVGSEPLAVRLVFLFFGFLACLKCHGVIPQLSSCFSTASTSLGLKVPFSAGWSL